MIRDETHRYALSYHRKRRELRDFTSELSAIPGVGEKRKGRLLRHFGSIQRIAAAAVSELTPFVGKKPRRRSRNTSSANARWRKAARWLPEVQSTSFSLQPCTKRKLKFVL